MYTILKKQHSRNKLASKGKSQYLVWHFKLFCFCLSQHPSVNSSYPHMTNFLPAVMNGGLIFVVSVDQGPLSTCQSSGTRKGNSMRTLEQYGRWAWRYITWFAAVFHFRRTRRRECSMCPSVQGCHQVRSQQVKEKIIWTSLRFVSPVTPFLCFLNRNQGLHLQVFESQNRKQTHPGGARTPPLVQVGLLRRSSVGMHPIAWYVILTHKKSLYKYACFCCVQSSFKTPLTSSVGCKSYLNRNEKLPPAQRKSGVHFCSQAQKEDPQASAWRTGMPQSPAGDSPKKQRGCHHLHFTIPLAHHLR